MARIRTIKPEFWTDGTIIGLPFEARLFYIGMWNHACDRGHMADDPFGLKLKILPADPVDADELLDRLVGAGRVERIVLPDGRRFLRIPRFEDHQRLDSRWNSRCPVCTHLDSSKLTETHASLDETHDVLQKRRVGGEGKGKEGNGEGGAGAPLSRYCKKHPTGTEDPCRGCGTARSRYEEAAKERKSRPAPQPFTPGTTCPNDKHSWLSDGTCTRCTERRHE